MLLILITSSHDSVWILLGENCCWSLLVLKGLTRLSIFPLVQCQVQSKDRLTMAT